VFGAVLVACSTGGLLIVVMAGRQGRGGVRPERPCRRRAQVEFIGERRVRPER
jgi:hypothetical protein